MTTEIKKQLKELINEQRERIPKLKKDDGAWNTYSYDNVENIAYTKWLENTKRFLNIHFQNDKFIEEFENLAKGPYALWPKRQQKLLQMLHIGFHRDLQLRYYTPEHISKRNIAKRNMMYGL